MSLGSLQINGEISFLQFDFSNGEISFRQYYPKDFIRIFRKPLCYFWSRILSKRQLNVLLLETKYKAFNSMDLEGWQSVESCTVKHCEDIF